jgi:bifunctional non-homologous end joining protein LigD
LPLGLPAAVSMPASVAPERATPCAEPFDEDGWRFSVDWDGARTIMSVDDQGALRLTAESGLDVTARYPELRFAAEHIHRLPAVLDGVVATLDPQGRPDLEGLGLRVALEERGAAQRSVVFLATDVLFIGAEPTVSRPLSERLQLLRELVGHRGIVQAPDTVEGRGVGLAEAAGQRGLTAVLARRAAAPYRPGVASPDRLQIALRPRATCVIVGIEDGAERPYLLLGEHDAGRLAFSGRVKGPRHAAVEQWLAQRAATLATLDPNLTGAPLRRFSTAGDCVWLRPGICATVSHEGRLNDGTLREPVLVAIRDDIDPSWCVRRDPVPPPARTTRSFSPTVLLPLPLDAFGESGPVP